MAAAAVGLPIWAVGVWADTVWEDGTWEAAVIPVGGGTRPRTFTSGFFRNQN